MARIRTIKPSFFKNEQLAELSFAHRLLFAGLWTQADRDGRLEDRPRRLKAEVFPYDDVDVAAMLTDMERGPDSLIVRYEADGKGYIWIRKFGEHQRPHYSEPASVYPPQPKSLTRTAEISAATAEKIIPATLGREGSEERKGREGKEAPAALIPISRGGLVGNHQVKCDPATWDACNRGLCVPNFLVGEWRNQVESTGGDAHSSIKAFVQSALARSPDYRGDPLDFWRAAWKARHGAPAVPTTTKTGRSIAAAQRVIAKFEGQR
jgi:hypothetical protein